jgi:hypothetical protein
MYAKTVKNAETEEGILLKILMLILTKLSLVLGK